ncbi:MAG TPA: immunoglobulin domain-containing protein [Candidatus Acidoferrales bacterium]|nr:immunoglobulin domain-containing protein [Candidatus Acidoferrales bacterium]
MNAYTSYTNVRRQSHAADNSRTSLGFFALLIATLVVLSISGCVGLTGAGSTTGKSSSGTPGTLALSTTSLNFGNVAAGSSSPQTLTLSNTGTTTVTILQATITGSAFSIVGGMTSVAIAPGQNQAFQIQFSPKVPGAATGGISISSDATNAAASIALSGTGTPAFAILTQPENQSVVVGHTAIFGVSATGTGTVTYQWKKNGVVIPGAGQSQYTTPVTTSADNGAQFSVVLTDNNATLTSTTAVLTVTASGVAPSVTTQPASKSVAVGRTATFSVSVAGTSPFTYQWKKNGAAISGATAASYTTPAATSTDNNSQFTVTVSNSVSSVTSSAAVLSVTVPPAISTQPASRAVTMGQAATFTVAATGTGTLTYQWKKNGAAISGATAASYTTPATTSADNGTQFTVTVSDTAGSVTSGAAILSVDMPPSITSQPNSQSVTAGQSATFSVGAAGTATLTYQWKKGGVAIAGATSASYTTPATTSADNATQFSVTVTNTFGTAASNAATLTVTAAPVAPSITSQPASKTVNAGQTAAFSVTASGTGTLTYQWKKNGAAISGATSSSYTTPATTASDSGAVFTVTVTGTSGNVTSSGATLTVNAAPSIIAQPASKSVLPGQPAIFSVTATGTATLTYQWSKGGTAISGATSASYSTPATTSADNGAQFTVTVSNGAGSVTSNAATLTVSASTAILNASTGSLNFSSVNIGSNSSLPVTFTNNGNSNVTISNVSLSGAGYTVSGVQTGLILTPGQSATMSVTFTPATAGSLPGSVAVTSNASNSPATITLSGTGVQAVSHSVTLTWNASTSTVNGYNVYRSTVSGGPYTKVNSSPINATTYVDGGVAAGQTYYYVVTSVDANSVESANSTEVSVVVP